MRSFKLFNRQAGLLVAAGALLFATVLPSIVSAAQLTGRSIALSTAAADANDVSYTVTFTSAATTGAAGAFVVDFCSESPIIGQACTTPSGFSAAGATSATLGFTDTTASANRVRATGTIAAGTEISVVFDHINNPTAAGPIYARIVTYDDEATADLHNPAQTFEQDSDRVDEGGAAISITNNIGVSAAVLETMTFCVSAADPTADCGGVTAPVLALGETVGTTKALSSGFVSTGSIYTQISTNAASGAVVSLKSNATDCGGLLRAGAPSACNIGPAQDDGIAAGDAKFGVKTSAATNASGATTPSGAFVAVTGSNYNTSTYALNYVIGDATGVTSAFGDPFLDTAGAPANNKNVQLVFGASVSNATPAGLYSADLNLIATGKF